MSTTDAWLSSVALYKSLKSSADIHDLRRALAEVSEDLDKALADNKAWRESYNNLRDDYAAFAAAYKVIRGVLERIDPEHPLFAKNSPFVQIKNEVVELVRRTNSRNHALEYGKAFVIPPREGGEPLSIPEYQALVDDLKTRLASAEKLLADAGVAQAQPVSNATLLARISGNQT